MFPKSILIMNCADDIVCFNYNENDFGFIVEKPFLIQIKYMPFQTNLRSDWSETAQFAMNTNRINMSNRITLAPTYCACVKTDLSMRSLYIYLNIGLLTSKLMFPICTVCFTNCMLNWF